MNPKVHVTFIWLVVFGSMMSAFWILVANSFMQHPVGYVINNGRAEMVDFVAVISNPKVWYAQYGALYILLVSGCSV